MKHQFTAQYQRKYTLSQKTILKLTTLVPIGVFIWMVYMIITY